MKLKYSITGIIIFFSSCFTVKPQTNIKQGLSGNIYLLKGNQMPSPGKPQSKGRGVSRYLFIYEPVTIKNTTGTSPVFTHIKTRLVARTKSDSTGYYAIKLPTGKYSVFIAEGKGFFAAESNGEGVLNPVEITDKTITSKDFRLTAGAAY